MKKLWLIIILIFSSLFPCLSQKATFLSIEAAANYDIFPVHDPCNRIETGNLLSGYWGFTLGHEIATNWVLETGFIRKNYMEGYQDVNNSYGLNFISSADAFYAIQIPLRLKKSFNLVRNRFFITPVIGYHLGYNLDYGYDSDSSFDPFFDSTRVYHVIYQNERSLKRFYSLIESGLSLDYYLSGIWNVSLIFSHYAGLGKIYHIDIKTQNNNCSTNEAFSYGNGSYWSLGLSMRCRVSNINRKKKMEKNQPKIKK